MQMYANNLGGKFTRTNAKVVLMETDRCQTDIMTE